MKILARFRIWRLRRRLAELRQYHRQYRETLAYGEALICELEGRLRRAEDSLCARESARRILGRMY